MFQRAFCAFCQDRIWGLGRQGFKCIQCKLLVHKKCHKLVQKPCSNEAVEPIVRDDANGGDTPTLSQYFLFHTLLVYMISGFSMEIFNNFNYFLYTQIVVFCSARQCGLTNFCNSKSSITDNSIVVQTAILGSLKLEQLAMEFFLTARGALF